MRQNGFLFEYECDKCFAKFNYKSDATYHMNQHIIKRRLK